MQKIQYLAMDVDGTLTDGKIYLGEVGELIKAFNIKDGYGIRNLLREQGIIPIVITGRESKILERRCKELEIDYLLQRVEDKVEALLSIVKDESLGCVAYIGDDLNDISCMERIKEAGGIIGAPEDAVVEVRQISDYVAPSKGGEGAVRDFIDWLITHIK